MIGYRDPNLGDKRRRQLAEYLRAQAGRKAAGARRMRAGGAFGGSRSPGTGTPFMKGNRKSSPEKFAFAGMKPSLKTLLGFVGDTMGQGGFANARFFSPDLPVGGMGFGGYAPSSPVGGPDPTMGTPSSSSLGVSPAGTPYSAPGTGGLQPPSNSTAFDDAGFNYTSRDPVVGGSGGYGVVPGPAGITQGMLDSYLARFGGPQMMPLPILGNSVYYNRLQ